MTTDFTKFLGKHVRYKRELLTKSFINMHGTVCRDQTFWVKEIRKNYKGDDFLYGYYTFFGQSVGRWIDPNYVEIIGERNET